MDSGALIESVPGRADDALALYVHVPFCQTKCPYCDFNTYAGIESLIPAYVSALRREVELWGELLQRPRTSTVFLGGGTPSYLPERELKRVLASIFSAFELTPDAEITMEANPGDLSPEVLGRFRDSGVNRLSIGVQSLDDSMLQTLGRRHSAKDAIQSVIEATNAGFANLNVDLMFGLPNQQLSIWEETLRRVLDLHTTHVSAYALTVEPNTPFGAMSRSGKMPLPDEDLAAEMYLLTCERLESAGFGHYEISNWARPGFESRHNLAYWRSAPYLGVGPGAHSYLPQLHARFWNIRSPRTYVNRLAGAEELAALTEAQIPPECMSALGIVDSVEAGTTTSELADALMMGLRLRDGVSIQAIASRFGADLRTTHRRPIADLAAAGLLEEDGDRLKIPHKSWIVGNEVFERMVSATLGTVSEIV